jgi:hypothetical protein
MYKERILSFGMVYLSIRKGGYLSVRGSLSAAKGQTGLNEASNSNAYNSHTTGPKYYETNDQNQILFF